MLNALQTANNEQRAITIFTMVSNAINNGKVFSKEICQTVLCSWSRNILHRYLFLQQTCS